MIEGVHFQNVEEILQKSVDRIFIEQDSNRDGSIDFEEYEAKKPEKSTRGRESVQNPEQGKEEL